MTSPAWAVVPSALLIPAVVLLAFLLNTTQELLSVWLVDLSHGLQAGLSLLMLELYGQGSLQAASSFEIPVSPGYVHRAHLVSVLAIVLSYWQGSLHLASVFAILVRPGYGQRSQPGLLLVIALL